MEGAAMPEYMRKLADAYRTKHKLLTSDEIVASRKTLGMTQRQFADYLSVGEASIKRWELGQIQDPAMDKLIRLKTEVATAEENLAYLNSLNGEQKQWRVTVRRISGVVSISGVAASEESQWINDIVLSSIDSGQQPKEFNPDEPVEHAYLA
jgi:DNA-binding transcriptional regulator YiaG